METLNQSPATTNLVIGNCIGCGGLVRIPLPADPAAQARCPHCFQSYALSAVLQQVIPELELISAQENSSPNLPAEEKLDGSSELTKRLVDGKVEKVPKINGKFVVPPQLANGARRRRHRRFQQQDADAAQNGAIPQSACGADADRSPTLSARARSARRRQRRRTRSSNTTAIEGLKVILGALLALPVAQLLIWWFIGADPLNFGRTFSRIMPFAVPRAFHQTIDSQGNSVTSSEIGEGESQTRSPAKVISISTDAGRNGTSN